MMKLDQIKFIREICTDKFEGIPCRYPHCLCSQNNRREMEKEWNEAIKLFPTNGEKPNG